MKCSFSFSFLFAVSVSLSVAWAQPAPQPQVGAAISGVVFDPATARAVEYATVTLKETASGQTVRTGVTDAKGAFQIEGVAAGSYAFTYGALGSEETRTAAVMVEAQRTSVDLGRLPLGTPAVKMERVEVQASPMALLNGIDRKVYNVGKEIQSTTGTASDLLQNIPSVQVDIEGNVSLRGSENVMILINGRSSALMGRSRAEVLQQLGADAIEKIEVITNPSAKYKPDGTAGIINIELKRKRAAGYASTVNVSVGNEERYNASLLGSYNPGKYSLFGSYGFRQEYRERRADEIRRVINPTTGAGTTLERHTTEHGRPKSQLGRVGVEFLPGERATLGLDLSYQRREQLRRSLQRTIERDGTGAVTRDFDRVRTNPDSDEEREAALKFEHRFAKEDHKLQLEFKISSEREEDDSRFENLHRAPTQSPTAENQLQKATESSTEFVAEYARPLGADAKLEVGYTLEADRLDAEVAAEFRDPVTQKWMPDGLKSHRFRYRESIHAFFATYGRTWGKLGVLAGLRPEFTETKGTLVATGATVANDYARVYPSLHFAYKLTEPHELQLNYSHRVNRPDADELNPFIDYEDPSQLRAGNPRLVPEDIHSIEAGYAFHGEAFTATTALYHRARYNGFTSVTRDLGNSVLLTTHENLGSSRSTGLELTGTAEFGKRASLNFSSNTFYNTIDASNLGFATRKSNVSWSAKLGATVTLAQETMLQVNTQYSSARLSAQGSRRPSYVANVGLRRNFMQKRASVVLTVSDVFNTMREATRLDTPLLQQEIVRRRSSRVIYVGFTYRFGKPAQKGKDEALKFDETI